MKKRKIAWICVAVILAAVVAVGVWQRNNLKAAWYYATMDQEQTQEKIEESEQSMLNSVGLEEAPTAQLTEEQLQQIADGTLSVDDAVNTALQESGLASGGASGATESEAGGAAQSSGTGTAVDGTDAELQRLVAKLYVLKASYTGRLESLFSQAKSEYNALPEDQRGSSAKWKIANSKLSAAAGLESSCDSQVSAVVDEIRSALKSAGRDTSLADQILSAYQQEKSLKKAYYLGQLN